LISIFAIESHIHRWHYTGHIPSIVVLHFNKDRMWYG